MTDQEALYLYRIKEADETLSDAKKMLEGDFSARSITNRAYYAMFYGLLALFLKSGIDLKTSKHVGVISLFDREFIHTNKIDKHYSVILHKMFTERQKSDYKDLVETSAKDASEHVMLAADFLRLIKEFIAKES